MADFTSIIFYAGIFTISAGLVYIGEKYHRRILVAFGLLVPVIYAALRLDVGIDYSNYVSISNGLSTLDFSKFLNSPQSKIYEHSLYYITMFSRLFPVWQVAFFGTYSAATLLPFYFGIRKVNPKYTWLAILFYLLAFFAPSLNGMRQFAAISIIFYATMNYLYSNKAFLAKICYFAILILLAVFFHSSAICGLLALPVIWLSKYLVNKPAGRIIFYSLVTMSIVVLLEFIVANNIEDIPILNRYAIYFASRRGGAPMPNMIPRLFPLFVGGWALFKKEFKNYHMLIYYTLMCIAFVLTCLGIFVPYGYRASDYFLIFQIPLFIEIVMNATNVAQRKVYLKIFIAYAIVYFLYSSVWHDSHGIMPYQLLFWY